MQRSCTTSIFELSAQKIYSVSAPINRYYSKVMWIEVFKTDIISGNDADRLMAAILRELPEYKINFDLNDRDHIMRVVSPLGSVDISKLTAVAAMCRFNIVPLPDIVPA